MEKSILLISDLPGSGKIALGAMMPVLSRMGHRVYNLPTALVSNTLDYGRYSLLETTDYMAETFRVWRELGFAFDAVAAGFLVSARQSALTADFCRDAAAHGARIFTDPIMADNGRLYNGRPPENADWLRELAAVSDLILPNTTEAALLTGLTWAPEQTDGELTAMLDGLRALGARSAVITGARTAEGLCAAGFDGETGTEFRIRCDEVPGRFAGAGDAFSSVLIGALLSGAALESAARRAADTVSRMLRRYVSEGCTLKGVPVERYFDLLDA